MSDETLDGKVKVCQECERTFPANTEHFWRNASYADGLWVECKECANTKARAAKERREQRKVEQKMEKAKARRKAIVKPRYAISMPIPTLEIGLALHDILLDHLSRPTANSHDSGLYYLAGWLNAILDEATRKKEK